MTDKIAQITEKMIAYDKGDVPRIEHFMKVYGYAAAIGKLEKLDPATQEILETAALLHDIGIKVSEEKYHSSAGKYQEIEGPAEARRLLMEAGADADRSSSYILQHPGYRSSDPGGSRFSGQYGRRTFFRRSRSSYNG